MIHDLEDEPIGWDSIVFSVKRDPDWHGLNYEYSDGDIQLEFDCIAGGDFIDKIYKENGLDAEIILQQGSIVNNMEMLEYTGRLVLSTFKRLKGRVACSVERKSLQDVVKARFDTKVDLFSSKDLDQNDLSKPRVMRILTHPKTIPQQLIVRDENQRTSDQGVTVAGTNILIYPNTKDPNNTIKQITQRDFGPVGRQESEPFFIAEVSGDFTFSIDLDWSLTTELQKKPGSIISNREYRNLQVTTYFEIKKTNGTLYYPTQPIIHYQRSKLDGKDFSVNCSFKFNGSVNIQIGERVYLFTAFSYTASTQQSINYSARLRKSILSLTGNSSTPPTYIKGMMLYETGNRILNSVTGKQNLLYSDFFGRTDVGYPVDGCGAGNCITNGFQLRQFAENKGIEISFKNFLESLSSIYCLGMAYENNSDGQEIVRVERIEHFYRDAEILLIEDAADYEEESAQELVFSSIEIGYKKYPEEGEKMLDEFNTVHEYVTPIRSHDNKFSKLSDLIASGYAIENTRRELYSSEGASKNSTKYDDDKFIISVLRSTPAYKQYNSDPYILFAAYAKYIVIWLAQEIQIVSGQTIMLSSPISSANLNIQYTINSFSVSKQNLGGSTVRWLYYLYVDETPVSETIYAPVQIRIYENSLYSSEKNENFTVQQGSLIDPASAYNLRLSPKRMLLNWAKWLNGGLMYKDGSELIKNTFVKQNGELTTISRQNRNCEIDHYQETIKESDPVALAGFSERDRIFIPDWVSFNARLQKNQINKIKLAMSNNSSGSDNYGYISVLDPDGNRVSGWIYEMEWSPNTEKVFFKLLKYKVLLNNTIPPDQENCQDYADWTFADFEASNIGDWIEDCRFDNFN